MGDLEPSSVQQAEAASTPRSADKSADLPQRLELITRTERRRHWSAEQKRAIVAESLAAGSSVLATARKYAIGTGQLYLWRHQMRQGELAEAGAAVRFVRVDPPAAQPHQPGSIEIVLPHGVVLRVDAAVDGAALRRVLAALSGR